MVHKGKRAYRAKAGATTDVTNGTVAKQNQPNRKAKIIVRNLPFKGLSDASVKELFAEFGDVREINLLKKDDGKYVGCGFVQFGSVQSAAKAIHHVNGRELQGRPVIVDWAVPKDTFIEKAQKIQEEIKVKKEENSDESDSDELLDFAIDNKPTILKTDGSDDSEEDMDEDGDDMEEDYEEEEEEEEEDMKNKMQERPRVQSNDADEGKTVFIKNIPFSVTNDELKSCFAPYGSIVYGLVCIDPITEHSRGTGFVKFKDKESAQQCIKDSANILVNGSPVEVTVALSKESLANKKKQGKERVKDSRNLYLVREGLVMAGSPSAEGVSTADMAKRLQIEQWKSQILRNLNMFVARTRLVVHNLPTAYDDRQLRGLFTRHSSPRAVVKEARVMRDRKQLDTQGLGRSKEVGFVTFTSHEDALAALRSLNNNPDVFTPGRRPIVGFSIENRAILNLKQKRVERSRAKQGLASEAKPSKLNSKQRRAIRRRHNIIQKRQEMKRIKRGEAVPPQETRKRKAGKGENPPAKKKKLDVTPAETSYSGVAAEPGKRVKPRSKQKLKAQATLHKQRMKAEKAKRKEQKKQKTKVESIKQPKQKRTKPNLNDDVKFTKLISQYRKKIEGASNFRKWYDV